MYIRWFLGDFLCAVQRGYFVKSNLFLLLWIFPHIWTDVEILKELSLFDGNA